MSSSLFFVKAKLRQWAYPREFRIDLHMESLWVDTLGTALATALAKARQPGEGTIAGDVSTRPDGSLNPDFVISLCNAHFRLRRNADLLKNEGQSSKEVRSITRALDKLERLMTENNIRSQDLTGERYDPGRTDFVPLGEPEIVPGLLNKQIVRCERPAIWLNDRLIQPARGIVGSPA